MNSAGAVALLVMAVAYASAQYRPFYAGSGFVYPRPISTNSGDDGLGDRGVFDSAPEVATSNRDSFGHDKKLIQDTGNLPRDVQPFWYINREHILRNIGLNPTAQAANPAAGTQPVVATQPAVFRTTSDFDPSFTTVDSSANLA